MSSIFDNFWTQLLRKQIEDQGFPYEKNLSTNEVTIKNRKAKDRKSSAKERQDSVLSVIDDVDALFKSSEPLPALDAASAAKSDDVMKELDELINC